VLKDNNSPLKNQNNFKNKGRNNVDKYDELDTALKVKEVTKGLAGLNTGNLKKEPNIISKKMIDNYNNNLRSETVDGTARKSKWVPTTNRNFFEENRLKIKAKEWENKEKEYQDTIKKLEDDKTKKKKMNLEKVLNTHSATNLNSHS